MKKILITGGAGFIASSLAERLLQSPGYFVVVVDNLSTGNTLNLPERNDDRWRFIKCDVNNLDEIAPIMTSYRFDYVFHYAAVVGVQRTLQHPTLVLKDIQGIKNILDLCKSTGVKRVFYSSSSEVYGEPVEFPQNEHTTPLNSRLPYAVVKNVGESFCRSYKQEFDQDFTIFRFFNTYGPRQSEDFVISKFLRAGIAGEPITIYGDGQQTRTFCYIEDHLDATIAAFQDDSWSNEVINIGTDVEISVLELARLIVEVTGSSSEIVHLPPLEEGDMQRRKPDVSNMLKLMDRPFTSLKDGLETILRSTENAEIRSV